MVGNDGSSNSLTIQNSGTVEAANVVILGNGGGTGNQIVLDSGTLAVTNGLTARSGNSLSGSGTINGLVTIDSGATLSPGSLTLSVSPVLQGFTAMELIDAVITNDCIDVTTGPMNYGGELTVTSPVGQAPDYSAGDRFQLFKASSYSGAFTNITLPTLPAGFSWTNTLSTDGSITVLEPYVAPTTPLTISEMMTLSDGRFQLQFNNASGANFIVYGTNDLALPFEQWTNLGFAEEIPPGSGQFQFIDPATGLSQYFYRLVSPDPVD